MASFGETVTWALAVPAKRKALISKAQRYIVIFFIAIYTVLSIWLLFTHFTRSEERDVWLNRAIFTRKYAHNVSVDV